MNPDRSAIRKHFLAHWFGCGLIPWAPGTMGSLGAVPLHMVLARTPPLVHAVSVLAVSLFGIWVAERASKAVGDEDPQEVVIDEVAGTLIAMGLVRAQPWWVALVALGLFRLLDITKPYPICALERLRPAGLGIMADDLLAGLLAGGLAYLGFIAMGSFVG
jgi:phosphatidylglycerophosphatase A